jgi:hypothetical protein
MYTSRFYVQNQPKISTKIYLFKKNSKLLVRLSELNVLFLAFKQIKFQKAHINCNFFAAIDISGV